MLKSIVKSLSIVALTAAFVGTASHQAQAHHPHSHGGRGTDIAAGILEGIGRGLSSHRHAPPRDFRPRCNRRFGYYPPPCNRRPIYRPPCSRRPFYRPPCSRW